MAVRLDRHDHGVVVLTLDDPDRRNALTAAMGDALESRCQELIEDDTVRAVVLTGSPPAFSAGGDLDMLEDFGQRTRSDDFDAGATMERFYRRFLAIRDLPVPVIAAINGHAIGAGLCVALAADLRIVAAEAKVGLNFARLGLHPGMGGTWFLPRILGEQRAAAWLYTGALASGQEAAAQGLALRAMPGTEVLAGALSLADDIAASSPVVVRQLKQTLAEADRRDLDAALTHEAAAQAICFGTADLEAGLAAARDRSLPTFTGR